MPMPMAPRRAATQAQDALFVGGVTALLCRRVRARKRQGWLRFVASLPTARSAALSASPFFPAVSEPDEEHCRKLQTQYPGKGKVDGQLPAQLAKLYAAGGRWPWSEAEQLCRDALELFKQERTLEHVTVPPGGHITVVGDLHGQVFDLIALIEREGEPSPENPYVFNGDFVDRGSYSVETLLLLLAWKVACPSSVHLAKGNHEDHDMNINYGFTGEAVTKYGMEAYIAFLAVFTHLPLVHVVNHEVAIVHGGLPRSTNASLADIEAMDRVMVQESAKGDEATLYGDLLWSDPWDGKGFRRSQRGPSLVMFGTDITEQFLSANSLRFIIRSHEVKDEGYEWQQGDRCLTVFSAPEYADACDNLGAVVRLSSNVSESPEPMDVEVRTFGPVPRPEWYVPAMRYSPLDPQCRMYLSEPAIDALLGFMGKRG